MQRLSFVPAPVLMSAPKAPSSWQPAVIATPGNTPYSRSMTIPYPRPALRHFVTLLAALLLTACANTPDMKAMSLSTRTDCFVLSEPMSYFGKKGLGKFESGLFADTYRAVLEDSDGIYYRGVGEGYWLRDAGEATTKAKSLVTRAPGGIWMPKKAGKNPALFMNEDLSGRPPIEYQLAQQNHTDAKAGLATGMPPAPANLNLPAPVHRNAGIKPIAANALGSAIGHAIVSGALASMHGRVVLMDWEGDSAAFWSGIESKRTSCKQ